MLINDLFKGPSQKLITGESDLSKAVETVAEKRSLTGTFAVKCSVSHKESNVTFHCSRDLRHPLVGTVNAIEFSDDGTLLASGGSDKIVRLWPISQAAAEGTRNPIVPVQMIAKNNPAVCSLAFTPKNCRLLSAGLDGKILIQDIQT